MYFYSEIVVQVHMFTSVSQTAAEQVVNVNAGWSQVCSTLLKLSGQEFTELVE